MKTRTDKLLVSVYARHGDSCSLAPHCESLGCASGYKPDDYVLSAKFAYLQEALDYILAITKHGLRARLISKIGPSAYISDYPKTTAA
jgi:hypothetical protein